MEIEKCPLCLSIENNKYSQDKESIYLKCTQCFLVFTRSIDLLDPDEEKKRYMTHENDYRDQGYKDFLYRLLTPLKSSIPDNSKGLDFGCGPGPAISHYLNEEGYEVKNYDPYFANEKSLLENKYDFLTCTEVIEHIYDVKDAFAQMVKLVNEKGTIGIMTQFPPDEQEKFSSWWYKNDPTHVRFFSKKTLNYMACEFNLDVEFHGKSVAIFKKR